MKALPLNFEAIRADASIHIVKAEKNQCGYDLLIDLSGLNRDLDYKNRDFFISPIARAVRYVYKGGHKK